MCFGYVQLGLFNCHCYRVIVELLGYFYRYRRQLHGLDGCSYRYHRVPIDLEAEGYRYRLAGRRDRGAITITISDIADNGGGLP